MREKGFFISVISAICFLFLLSGGGYAQEEDSSSDIVIPEKLIEPARNTEACVRNFNIDKADLSNPVLKGYLPYLLEYLLCRSAQENNPRWCNVVSVNSQLSFECNDFFNQFHAYFGRSLVAKQITREALSACMARGADFTEQVCRDMIDGILNQDTSKCNKMPTDKIDDCRNLVGGSGNSSLVIYVQAIRSGHVSSCSNIPNNRVQWLCTGALNSSKSSCEDSRGFDTFRRKYCEIMTQ